MVTRNEEAGADSGAPKRPDTAPRPPTFALALGGGAARGLAHIGVIDVLRREGLRPDAIVGTSMGAIIGALAASGVTPDDMQALARGFRFPRRFVLGGVLRWEALFGSVIPGLGGTFEQLEIPLAVTAASLGTGNQVIMRSGDLLPAVKASSSVPGVMPPVRHDTHWLVDGGLLNVLPVDVAWITEPDFVVGVDLGSSRPRRLYGLGRRRSRWISRLGEIVPNPVTARLTFEIMVRATEIMLDRQTVLAAAMTGPEVLIQPTLGDIALRDFHKLDEAVAAGRRATEAALPRLRRLLEQDVDASGAGRQASQFWFDPVCAMVINPAKVRATLDYGGATYRFCSFNCRDYFRRDPTVFVPEGIRHRPTIVR